MCPRSRDRRRSARVKKQHLPRFFHVGQFILFGLIDPLFPALQAQLPHPLDLEGITNKLIHEELLYIALWVQIPTAAPFEKPLLEFQRFFPYEPGPLHMNPMLACVHRRPPLTPVGPGSRGLLRVNSVLSFLQFRCHPSFPVGRFC